MKRERYTIAIMPYSGRRMRTFSISMGSTILILLSFAIIFTSTLTLGSLATWRFYRKQRRLVAEATQNSEILRRQLQKELREIRRSYSEFRNTLGIEMAEPDDEMGKGGPDMPELTDFSAEDLSVVEIADDAVIDLSSTLMEAASLRSDLEDLTITVKERITELATTPSIWPVKVELGTKLWISSKFGTRRNPFNKKVWERHEGIDISSRRGTPLVATADGTIADMGKDTYLGNLVEISHSEKFSTLYGHMDRFAKGMERGTKVDRGDVIGYMGRTGRATGSHVHYEVRVYGKPVNPVDYILN